MLKALKATSLALAIMGVVLSIFYAVAVNAQPQNFRFMPGEIKIDLDEEIDLAWVFNQALINEGWAGLEAGLHWRPSTQEEKNTSGTSGLRCIVLSSSIGEVFKGLCWPADFPENQTAQENQAMYENTCKIFNRNVKNIEGRIITCGEPLSPDFKDVPKHKNQA